jgi:hypothetical protein
MRVQVMSRIRWAPALAAAVVAIAIAGTTAVAADSGRQCTADGRAGCAEFFSDGDRFLIYDGAWDHHGVVVVYDYGPGFRNRGYAWNYYGTGRWRRDVEDHSGPMRRRTCLADYTKPDDGVPAKEHILWTTCGGTVNDDFGR